MAIKDYRNIHEMLLETVNRSSAIEAYRWIDAAGALSSVTWAEFYREVRRAARSLIALGVGHGDKVAIVSYTRYRWILTDLAAATIGACTVGVYQTLLAKDIQYIVDHSDAVLAFMQDTDQLAKLRSVREHLPKVRKAVLFDGRADDGWAMSYESFLALGEGVAESDLDQRIAAIVPGDPAAIVYTSGTTGIPKGAILTHDNLCFTSQSVRHCLDIRDGEVAILFLPLAHVFARTCAYFTVQTGVTTMISRGLEFLLDDFALSRPHWFASVPAVYDKAHAKALATAEAKGGVAQAIFNWACAVGRQVSDLKLAHRPIPPLLALRYRVADALVFSKIRARFGGRVRWCISGAAPLNPTVGRFFHAAGVNIVEGIGMTENTSFSNVNRLDTIRYGWVGPTGPGIEQRIAEDGEIQFRGRNVMKGYYKMPAETAEAITPQGWLRTGDLGEIDADGFLRVTGRKKDLIITSGGKNVAPVVIEVALATSKYISRACVVGDRRKYLTALVSLDLEQVAAYARQQGIPFNNPVALRAEPRIIALINAEVEQRNRQFASFETIKKITLVEEFTIDNGLLTPTLKVRRSEAAERYRDVIEAMYREE
jgi:long-chain acyl-CoA synthetase